ncbi:hypothetical protein B5M42_013950 [Paenibacillus athensensis]|uniref:histidine kinase n=1 Tax=Paenibacillus athensensis TaxID=1967502 RepID=A0A4Y8PYL9_9BACL|nr:ATP-binding protein [Paenibacillus athensensis]MCD1259935.1 hypothetical protein [Paenibacillus athensensis]
MVKDLFLQVLAILVSIMACQFMLMGKSGWNKDWLFGIIGGICAVFCVTLPISFDGFRWDLRWVPLILTFLYGSRRAGLLATVMMLLYRIAQGGDALFLVYFPVLLNTLYLSLLRPRFIQWQPWVRVPMLVACGLFSFCVTLSHLYIYSRVKHETLFFQHGISSVLIIAALYVVTMLVAGLLIENIAETFKMRQELAQSEKLMVMSELAASVAHEIRNPLTVVRGFLQLTRETLVDKNKEFITTAIAELDRAEKIISDYLSFAKPQLEHISELSLVEIVRTTTDLIQAYAVMHGVELQVRLSGNPLLNSDKYKLQQVLMNVMKNAVEAIEGGGTVEIEIAERKDQAIVLVTDTGKGMTPEQLKRLGSPYYSMKETGTGLGLMVTFRLIEAMKGTIRFTSVPGTGTQVEMMFPLAR